MFDSFHAEVKCPYCKAIKEQEFQVKVLDNSLDRWILGDLLLTAKTRKACKEYSKDEWLDIKEAVIWRASAFCDCKEDIEAEIIADIIIRDGKFAEIKNIRKLKVITS